jgi:enterochelin esterase family protein
MNRQKIRIGMLLGLLLLGSTAPRSSAQPARQPTPNDRLVSPEILSDHRVTFRIYAPKASEVKASGDFGKEVTLTKDDEGVWSATVGPLTPDYYNYTFSVDGVRTVDPKNPTIKPGIESIVSMFFLPGKEADFEENQNVPHGDIRQLWYQSSTLQSQRRMHVYTPPGYDASTERYPVLYLLHGSGDEDSGWSTIGRAGFILDNLIAQKKAKPMLIVMPNGSMPRPKNLPRFERGKKAPPAWVKAMSEVQQRFASELLTDIVPLVEKRFRVREGMENRALAGLSMGGMQTLATVTGHPDQFAYVGVWSAGILEDPADWEKRNATFLDNADKINKTMKLLSISIGDKDFLLDFSRNLTELLKKHGVKHEEKVTGGAHTWIVWRQYLHDFAPQLFR